MLSIGLAAIFSGILVGGDRIRANYSSENPEDFLRRKKIFTFLFWFAVPNLLLALVYYYSPFSRP